MTNSTKLHSLVENFKSKTQIPNNQVIEEQINTVKIAIAGIQGIIADPDNSTERILIGHLGSISSFFRQKFSTLVFPVLESLKGENPELWAMVKSRDTNIPLTPKEFENIPISNPNERELHLLAVYLSEFTKEYDTDKYLMVLKHLPAYKRVFNIIGITKRRLKKIESSNGTA